jgi:prepilin-type N-terminal cleavage/methylation domain-containing protein/prepilin-type processing-associated H-X9-DG protein
MAVHRRGAFTLIELLVVIAVIALLIGILLPALASARGSGRSVKCMSNQRQIGLAMSMYANDKKDFIPREGVLGLTDLYSRPGWAIGLRPYLDDRVVDRVNFGDQFSQAPYYQDPVRILDGHNIHYIVNAVPFLRPGVLDTRGSFDDNYRRGPCRLSNFPRPAQCLYVTDFAEDANRTYFNTWYAGGTSASDLQIAQYYDIWALEQFSPLTSPALRTFPKRHGNGSNAVFLDCHARRMLADECVNINTWDDCLYKIKP